VRGLMKQIEILNARVADLESRPPAPAACGQDLPLLPQDRGGRCDDC